MLAQRRAAADLKARTLDTQVNLARALGGGYAADAKVGGSGDTADAADATVGAAPRETKTQ